METIVIAGGGAGGLELATRLGDALGYAGLARIVLVDRWPGHFWKPLLHTVAAGLCDARENALSFAAQAAQHDFEFVQGELLCVDRARRSITLSPADGGDGVCRVARYDRLVLALGAVSNFYGVPGAAEHALTLDDVSDAEAFRRRLIAACVRAAERKAPVKVVVAGGGATGVELAAELSQGARSLADLRITVIERGPRLLPQLDPQQSARAARHLRALGVEVLTSTAVAAVTPDAVIDDAGNAHGTDLTLWTAGVEAPSLCAALGLAVNHLKQVVVDAGLRSVSDAGIYAFGDCASHVCPVRGAAPPRAQVAHQQAMFLAELFAGRGGDGRDAAPAGFRYHDHGALVSLGARAA